MSHLFQCDPVSKELFIFIRTKSSNSLSLVQVQYACCSL